MTDTLSSSTAVTVTRPAGNIGAEIGGVDASGPVSNETVARIREALLTHKVVFRRDHHLVVQDDVELSDRFLRRVTSGTRLFPNAVLALGRT